MDDWLNRITAHAEDRSVKRSEELVKKLYYTRMSWTKAFVM